MARQLGSATLGLASETGFPLIDGGDTSLLSYPAFTSEEALRLTPNTGSDALIGNWVIGMDVYIPQPASSFVSLFQTGDGDGELFLRDNGDGTAGIGISGVYEGAVPFDAWTRIVVTVTEEGGNTILRKYVDSALVGTQDLGVTERWDIDPALGLSLFTDDSGETAPGAVSGVFFSTDVPSAPEVAGALATIPTPNAGGFFPGQPSAGAVEINFDGEDIAPRYGDAQVALDGFGLQTPAVINDSAIALASQFEIDGPDGADIPVLDYAAYAPNEGILVDLPDVGTDLTSYTAIWDIRFDELPGFQALLQTDTSQSGDGELFIRSDGGIGINGDYDGAVTTDTWHRIAITVEDQGDGTSLLSKYLDGVFLDSQSVDTARFTLSRLNDLLLLTDNDGETATGHLAHFGLSAEVLDADAIAALGGASGNGPLTEQVATGEGEPVPSDIDRNLTLQFSSSFRPYDSQTGEVLVSFDGGTTFTSLLTLDTSTVPGGTSSLDRVNETVSLDFTAPAGTTDVQFRFDYTNADNDWWWAIDNIALSEGGAVLWAENFDGLTDTLQPAVDENIPDTTLGWTHTTPADWARTVDAPQGTTEWQGWSFTTPEFWTTADGQNRTDFTLGTGVIAIADGDEWDDFNTGSVTGDDFNTTLATPLIDLSLPAGGAVTHQFGFDGYAPTVEFGFDNVTLIDEAPEAGFQDNIKDLLLVDDGTPVEIDLPEAFGTDATDFVVTSSDGTVVDAQINGATLTLSGAALGHSDLTVTAQAPGGGTLTENFRAIVAGENAYVFAIIPDTQDYTSNPGISETFGNMTDWLLAQQQSLGIIHAIHVGDIVQFGAEGQWQIAEEAMERLDGQMTYSLAVGNHDQQRPGFSSAFSFETDIDTYFTPEQLGATPAQGGGTYDGFDVGEDTFGNGNTYADSVRNYFTTLTAPDGTKWLILNLEFGMPDDVLRWASEVVEGHLDHRVIINTHSWNGGDGRITPTTEALNTDNGGWGYAIRENPRSVNDGEDAWREFASKYPNVTFTFNGHNFMGGAETVVSYTDGGNPAFQMFVNYQGGAWAGVEGIGTNGGNGAMRLVVIDPDNDRISTHTKLVELDTYFEEFPDHQEVFEGIDVGTPEDIVIADAGETMVVTGDGIKGTVTLDPSESLGDIEGAVFAWFTADGEKLGETDGTPLEVDLQTGTNRLTLKVTDADGNVSTDDKVVIVEAPDALLTETFDDGDLAGWGAPAGDPGDLFDLGTDLGFSLPSIGGVEQIPVTLKFDSSFRPYDNQTGEVMVSFDEGQTFSTLLTLDTASVPGGQSSLDRANETISLDVLAPNSASSVTFAWRMSQADNDWWWAIDNVEVLGPPEITATEFWSEDFDSLAGSLQAAVDETDPGFLGWTQTTPASWNITVDAPQGTTEWQGWSFATPDFWVTVAGDQSRSTFTNGTGVIAIADGDEWDDNNTGSVTGDDFNTMLTTDAISLAGQGTDAGDVDMRLSFDSSFRPYDAMTGEVLVSFDGGAFTSLLTLDTSTVPGGSSSLSRSNEAVELDFTGPQGTTEVQFRFDYLNADNDWWWAIDNLSLATLTTTAPTLLAEDFDGLPLQNTVDEPDPGTAVWTPTPPAGWTQEVADTTSQGSTEFQGWTFMSSSFWIDTAGNQSRDTFTLGTGNVAVADPDEWDDFNAGAAGDTDEFDSTLSTPAVDITAIGGGQPAGSEAGVLRAPPFTSTDGILVMPTNSSGMVDTYTVIFDILLTETAQTFTALYQTDVTNSGDAEIYLRNDGATASIGISGDYDGTLAYGDWGRLALVFETDGSGQQVLSKYLDGALLDTQIVDADISDGSRWSIDADAGFLLFSEPNGFTSEIYTNAIYFAEEALDATAIDAFGGVDVDGPADAATYTNDFQLSFDAALDDLDFGAATVEPVSLAGPDATSYIVKGSIYGNPDGVGEAALYQQSNGANEILVWMGEGAESWNNYVFDMVVEPADNDVIGAVFYYADDENYYQLLIDQEGDTRTLLKVEGGVETTLAMETGSYRHFAMQDLRIAVLNGVITITLDDEMLFGSPVTDAAPLSGGSVGVAAQLMDRVLFDNVSVNPVDLAARVLTTEAAGKWAVDTDGDGTATVDLTAAASLSAAGIASYEWLVDGEVLATGETAALDLEPGETTVILRVTDSDGAVSEDRMTVSVADNRAILAADDFEDGDFAGWTIVDEGTIGGPSDWQVLDGALVQATDIQSDQQGTGSAAYSVGGDGPYVLRDGTYALWDNPDALSWTNYAVDATITPNDDDGIGLLVRYTDPDNYYKLEADAQTGLVMLTRHLEGRETILARGYMDYTPGEAQQWRIEVEDGVISTYIDGKAVFGTVVEDRSLPTGTVGLYGWGSENLSFDDIIVTDLDYVPPAPALEVVLVNAATDEVITTLGADGTEVLASDVIGKSLTIAAFVPDDSAYAGQVESIRLDLNDGDATKLENFEPYSLFGDFFHYGYENYLGATGILEDQNTVSFDLYSEDLGQGALLETITRDFTVVDDIAPMEDDLRVVLLDARRGTELAEITDGAQIDQSLLERKSVSIAVYVEDDFVFDFTESMRLTLNDGRTRVDNTEPYTLFGDFSFGEREIIFGRRNVFDEGENELQIDLYSDMWAGGEELASITLDFEIGDFLV